VNGIGNLVRLHQKYSCNQTVAIFAWHDCPALVSPADATFRR